MTAAPAVLGAAPETDAVRLQGQALVEACLRRLTALGVVNRTAVDWTPFETRLPELREEMRVDQSAISTRMARLLFALACVRRPKRVLVVGSYQGAALVWMALAAPGAAVIGVDIDPEANAVAEANLRRAGLGNAYIRLCDGHVSAALHSGPIDLLLLDAEEERNGHASKRIYLSLLRALAPRLAEDALVLAHDACWPPFAEDFDALREIFAETGMFTPPVTLGIDRYGLMLARSRLS